jgi:lysophospholipase L1-like esterase
VCTYAAHHELSAQRTGNRSVWVSYCKFHIIPCFETHKPLDLVIILLGTNDLKMRFSVSAYDIANGAGALVQIVQKSETGRGGGVPQVLLLAPPPVAVGRAASALTGFAEMFEGAEAKSRRFAEHYARVAQERGCAFLDTGQVIFASDLDGIHLEASEQEKLGVAVAEKGGGTR